jgi:hypothetical protein
MNRIGGQLLSDSKMSIETSGKGHSFDKSGRQARDLLSLLVRANIATELPESQRLTDTDVVARVYPSSLLSFSFESISRHQRYLHSLLPAMKARGKSSIYIHWNSFHVQCSSGTTWALYALTQNPAVQTKLRNELLTLSTDNPTMDELNSLPYLDHVVRETLRVHAPVPATFREAMKDDVLPLSKPFTDKKGKVCDRIQ